MNEGGVGGLFTQHVEKAALGLAVILALLLVYFGSGNKPIGEDRGPTALASAVDAANANIAKSTWFDEKRAENMKDPDYHVKANQIVELVKVDDYPMSYLDPPIRIRLAKRTDPTLFPVTDLEVQPGVVAALAVTDKGGRRLTDVAAAAKPRGGAGGLIDDDDEEGDKEGPPDLRPDQKEGIKGHRPAGSADAKGSYFVSVRGLVPTLKQNGEYDRCFARAHGRDPGRDEAKYIYYYVERAEVTAEGTPGQWKQLSTTKARALIKGWAGQGNELADPMYIYPGAAPGLTMPPPPAMLVDPEKYLLHSAIPRIEVKEEDGGEDKREEKPEPGEEGEDIPDADVPGGDRPKPEKGRDVVGDPGVLQGPRKNGADEEERIVEHHLFRFFDFTVDPNKSYRYRVKLLVEDPNDPRDGARPKDRCLAEPVIQRLRERQAKDLAERNGKHTYWLETEWGEPSQIVSFPSRQTVVAGEVLGPKAYPIPGTQITVQTKEASATLMALIWDPDEAVWVPGVAKDMYRGSVVDFQGNPWVLDPVSLGFRQLPDYDLHTGAAVIDLFGGDQLPTKNRKSKLRRPGEVLLIDGDGNLVVRSECDDADEYWKYYYGPLDEEDAAGKTPEEKDEGIDGLFRGGI